LPLPVFALRCARIFAVTASTSRPPGLPHTDCTALMSFSVSAATPAGFPL
jgi:hypothetical protein